MSRKKARSKILLKKEEAMAGRKWVDEWNRAFDVAREEIEKSKKTEDST